VKGRCLGPIIAQGEGKCTDTKMPFDEPVVYFLINLEHAFELLSDLRVDQGALMRVQTCSTFECCCK